MLTIDGSYGEGGGQILRTALALSAITGTAVRVTAIRAGRSKPGLRPQHLTAVRAAAAICNARLEGDALNSQTLSFAPQTPPQPGTYTFDVAEAARGGSAGSVTLVLQTVLLPLALAPGPSTVTLRGGTNVPMSPPALYLEHVYLPTLFDVGVRARLEHRVWGFYPPGGGELVAEIAGGAQLRPLTLVTRGAAQRVDGVAFAAQLPSHIPQRMTDRASAVLRRAGLPRVHIDPQHVTARSPGAGLFLTVTYAGEPVRRAGFDALGRKGLPSERVAEMACDALLAHHRTEAALDPHMADQLVLPLALASGTSTATTSKVTRHLLTNAWLVERFGFAARVEGEQGRAGTMVVGE